MTTAPSGRKRATQVAAKRIGGCEGSDSTEFTGNTEHESPAEPDA